MKKIVQIFFLLCTVISFAIQAQDRTVSGKISSVSDGSSLPGVNVILKGTSTGTVSDVEGNYRLQVPQSGGVLVFSFIGFASEEVEIAARSVIDVRLSPDITELSEVVVTAFGIEKEQKSLGYAVSEVEGDILESGRNTNMVNSLAGRVAGLQVTSTGGAPGQSSRVNLRGVTSLTGNNQPLFIIDGIPMNNSDDSNTDLTDANTTAGAATPNRAGDINPADIETITVLKGATAAALYGIRAANGAIVITTKSGKQGDGKGARVTFSSTFMADEVLRTPDYQTRWAQGSVDGVYANGTSRSFGPLIQGQDHVNALGQTLPLRSFDNLDAFFETGKTFINNVSVTGGDDVRSYYFSVGRTLQSSYIPNQDYNRFSIRLNASTKVSDKISTSFKLNYIKNDGDLPFSGQDGNNPIFALYQAPVSFDLGGYPFQNEDGSQVNWRGGSFDNPFWTANRTFVESQVDRIIASADVTYQVLDWISITARAGSDYARERRKDFKDIGTANGGGGNITNNNVFRREINTDIILGINRNITKDLSLNLLLGHNINQRDLEQDVTTGTELVLPNTPHISNSTPGAPIELLRRRRLHGAYFDAQFAYKNMLFFGVTGRNDWSSTLPVDERSFFYPSVNAAFAFTDAILLESDILSFGKIRASYAQVGNDAPVYSLAPVFEQAAPDDGFTQANAGLNFPFGGRQGFTAFDDLGNPLLKPERITSLEIGADLRFFNNRIGLDVNYFQTESTDQIISVSVSDATGFTNKIENVGQLDSKGWEFLLTATPVKTSSFSWDISANVSRIRTEVVEIIDGVDNIFLGGFTGFQVRADIGERYGSIIGGAFLRDTNGNIQVDSNPNSATYGFPQLGEISNLGHVEPDWTGGIRNTLTYKDFTLDFLIETRQGGFIMNGTTELLQFYGRADETDDRTTPVVFDGVIVNEDGSSRPNDISILKNAAFWNQWSNITEANVYENNWVKLRSVNLTYNLPKRFFEGTFIEQARFTLTGRNLLLFTNVPDIDPETSAFGSGNAQGFSRFDLPSTRSYGASINIVF
ncbi:SusC/RagA family TonB-linked outer membrane protein [Fulvivirga sp. M361]|uniref:SusC/RagA family TonB-linked outer membrane protein n=1 Tax=Fulvivirga sp. M361 TaxID=2594266 RepID=UPI00117A27BB|nr:SusC/RagA family TonB-linked outer membrane protein [Fulvivirga sp. M361]TRX62533.1 SusC/RagA family TonB-linked outer membrane protein [Fulvivirga sp. M361]